MSPPKPPRPPTPPTKADASIQFAGQDINAGYSNMIQTTPLGLRKRPTTAKQALIGGGSPQVQ